jgi:L-seryl-tRNA(Ser) seleniumtransferase
MTQSRLRAIPSVEKILQALGDSGLPRPIVLGVVRRELGKLRKQKSVPAFDAVVASVRNSLRELHVSRIRPLINATGILIHTNFGRAPLGTEAVSALTKIGSSYSNLEYDLISGTRGGRAGYLEQSLAVLCGAEAATVVNNNAAALVLILRHFCQAKARVPERRTRHGARHPPCTRNEVIISRGELIQIGGGFRIPDILESSGARLREVGTTNKTSLRDYARAIGRETALILKVHHSNFYMEGFVESAPAEAIAALARQKRIPFVEDLGSGAMVETRTATGLEHEPTPAEVIGRGVDLVCFSGDKLFGGPQAGVIAGNAKLIAGLKRDPFFRALRCDKLILAALEATTDTYLSGQQGIPVLEMLQISNDELRVRAAKIQSALSGVPITVSLGVGQAQIGGGTLPRSMIESVALDLTHSAIKPQELAARLREHSVPVIGYVARGKVKLDLRSVFPRQDAELIAALRSVCQ